MAKFQPFLVALQFLTTLPVKLNHSPDNETLGRSLLYYPLVGLIIGSILTTLAWLLSDAPELLTAALLLAIWVVLTGMLHLDGLADSADAWIGGLGDRDKTLAIMKDPYCGPAAVTTLVLLLLIKFTALTQLITHHHWAALAITPLLGRAAVILLFLTTPYVRQNGLGNPLANHMPRRAAKIVLGFTALAVFLLLDTTAFWLILVLIITFVVLRNLMLRRIGGTTGDTAGAMVETVEMVVLATLVLVK